MISVTVVICVMPPPVALTVMVWVPAGAFAGTATVMVEVPEPGAGIGLGLKVANLTVDDRVIAESNPPDTVVVRVVVPELPAATVIGFGEALMVKPGNDDPKSALIRPLPFGLPQPLAKS